MANRGLFVWPIAMATAAGRHFEKVPRLVVMQGLALCAARAQVRTDNGTMLLGSFGMDTAADCPGFVVTTVRSAHVTHESEREESTTMLDAPPFWSRPSRCSKCSHARRLKAPFVPTPVAPPCPSTTPTAPSE
ncbi:hypothetical protein BU16DRAFT_555274 [Lophium mytilinum]|uniref:Uncharacterized protein n=1 Tax=Lophium mytilinum TaxID=390894 RepID=A0A6A6RIG7_9PEZI|nr:hypothetical protein BU16DRAFT_555274 [Lophium mytilinum]